MVVRLVLAAVLAATPLHTLAQAPKPPGGAAPSMPVKAVAAKMAPAVDEATAVGTLRADESITVRPEVAGRIVEIRFSEGQGTRKGDLLARLDSAELAAVVASSSAQLTLDVQRMERSEDLFRKGFISQQALDDQRTSVARARAKLAEDQAKLAKTDMRAPFPGVMGLRQVSEGAFVAAGTDIARLEKIDALKLDFRVPEAYLARLKVGQVVHVTVDAYPQGEFSGAVYAIEPGVDEQTRTVQARARVANSELKLRPGMFARVRIGLAVREQAIWVPEASIVPRGRDATVFRIVDGKAELVRVLLGARKVGEVEIVKGIAAGDMVVTEGAQRIGPGAAVRAMADAPAGKAAGAGPPGK